MSKQNQSESAAAVAPVSEFAHACRARLQDAEQLLGHIIASPGPRGLDNTLVPYNRLVVNLSNVMDESELRQAVHPDQEQREVARTCQRQAQQFVTGLMMNRDLYEAFVAVKTEGFDPATRRLVDHTLRDFRRNGVDKDDATRRRLEAIDEELVALQQQFDKNIAEDVREIKLGSVSGLAGLPADYIAAHPPGKDGAIRITTQYPDYLPFMSYARSHELRRALFVADQSRGGDENERILKDVLALRHEKARLLGFAHWADYITADKMMKSAANAAEFIARVVNIARPRGRSDYEQLLASKRREHPGAMRAEEYERLYYSNRVKAETYAFDAQEARGYFPYEQVERGLLDVTAEMYGVSYRSAQDAPVWHSSVKAYDVVRDGATIGRIYLDMHPRPGKYQHAARFSLRKGVAGVQQSEGVLVCNFPDPRASSGPALMEHSDVVTMFHEFGHLMHGLFGGQNQRWAHQSGIATEWDFVEAPSQMFEEWAWSFETLERFAKHHETGRVIPQELVAKMRRAKHFGLGLHALQQMFYASLSLNFHKLPPAELDLLAELQRLKADITPFAYVQGTRFFTSFGHLTGYSAMYYTYMWSLVIAKDLFTPFRDRGLLDRDWNQRYRDRILAPGGTKDATELVQDFLGRPFNYEAFEKYLGEG